MKRNTSRSLQQSEKYKSSRSEDLEVSRSRSEEEKMLRRREWRIQQDRAREHEILKQKKIYEYEMRRAREKGLPLPKAPTFGCSKSRSKSPGSQPRRTSSSATNTPILSERLESADGKVPLFKGPEGTKISAVELRRIKVDIHRNIPGKSTGSELLRDIINPEDVIVKRRAGEGSKPIFEREEIKGITTKAEEVEEHRTVVTVNNETIGMETQNTKTKEAIETTEIVIIAEAKAGSIETVTDIRKDDIHNHRVLRKSGAEKVVITRIQGREKNANMREIPITGMTDLIENIEKDPESALEIEETEIDLGIKEFLCHITLNKFLYQFVMVIFRQDQ